MFWSNIYAKIRLYNISNKEVQLWTKYNAVFHLIDGGFYAFPCPTLADKHYMTRHMTDRMTKYEVARLSNQLGYEFKVYPFGDDLLYRISNHTDTK